MKAKVDVKAKSDFDRLCQVEIEYPDKEAYSDSRFKCSRLRNWKKKLPRVSRLESRLKLLY